MLLTKFNTKTVMLLTAIILTAGLSHGPGSLAEATASAARQLRLRRRSSLPAEPRR